MDVGKVDVKYMGI